MLLRAVSLLISTSLLPVASQAASWSCRGSQMSAEWVRAEEELSDSEIIVRPSRGEEVRATETSTQQNANGIERRFKAEVGADAFELVLRQQSGGWSLAALKNGVAFDNCPAAQAIH